MSDSLSPNPQGYHKKSLKVGQGLKNSDTCWVQQMCQQNDRQLILLEI